MRWFAATICAGACLGVVGCEEPPAKVAPIHAVKGKVKLPSSSASNGLKIMFLPDGGNGKTATGAIKPDGSFELTTETPGDGIAEGKYRIQMSWTPPPSARAQKGQVPVPPIPANYLDAEDSGLVAEINASTTEVGPFDLTATKASKVKEKMRD